MSARHASLSFCTSSRKWNTAWR